MSSEFFDSDLLTTVLQSVLMPFQRPLGSCNCATTTMFARLMSARSKAQVTRTRRFGTVLSEAQDGSDAAVFDDNPILFIR